MTDYNWKQPTELDAAIGEVQRAKKKLMYYQEMVVRHEGLYKSAAETLKKLLEES